MDICRNGNHGISDNYCYNADVYDLLYTYYMYLKEDLVFSNEILDKEYYDKVIVIAPLTLE